MNCRDNFGDHFSCSRAAIQPPAVNNDFQPFFQPILSTTLTTFGGLGPMIWETSRQARFMIPMAISLGYGILFSTAIMLVLIPCLYLIAEDVLGMFTAIATPATEKVQNEPEGIVAE